jgi:ferric-dicitrate binding protein FerR (iron transport regulator)
MRTWPALLLAPVLALADQSVAYAMVGWSCASQNHAASHWVHAAFLLATIATLVPAWRAHRTTRASAGRPRERGSREAFTAQLALLVGALSAAMIGAMWIPQWVLSPCFA